MLLVVCRKGIGPAESLTSGHPDVDDSEQFPRLIEVHRT